MPETNTPTLKELIKRHNITYRELYEYCDSMPTEDISIMYRYNRCTKAGAQKMLAFINKWAGTSYTIEDIFIEKML